MPVIVRTHESVDLSAGAGLRQITVDPREVAVASLPSWRLIASAGDKLISPSGAIANRASADGAMTPYTTGRIWSVVTVPDSPSPMFDTGTAEATAIRYRPNVVANNTEWSVALAMRWPLGASATTIIQPEPSISDSRAGVRIALATANAEGKAALAIRRGDATAQISTGANVWADQTIVGVFSRGPSGSRIRINGVQMAFSSTTVVPLDVTGFTIAPDFKGWIGDVCLYDRDLGAADQAAARGAIETWLMAKHGLI
ncbi:hypothetical protein WMC41_15890 [Shinella yambaruensis]|uniref:hypothetical protein n=1 Tax=Shinella yambaruensis TaxID=415996 RepID=UPI003D7A7060